MFVVMYWVVVWWVFLCSFVGFCVIVRVCRLIIEKYVLYEVCRFCYWSSVLM